MGQSTVSPAAPEASPGGHPRRSLRRRAEIELSPSDPQSHPAFLDGFFAGIEFPVASTRLENGDLILAHRPGLRVTPGVWYETRKAVYGVAPRGDERRAFERYIAAHRPGPKGFHVNYNSWWTSPVPYRESDILGIERIFEEKLYKPYGVSFDTFCIDMGWSDLKSVWSIDKGLFPDGFANIRRAAERMKSHLGLWISPCSGYPGAVDNEQAARDGYETFVDRAAIRLSRRGALPNAADGLPGADGHGVRRAAHQVRRLPAPVHGSRSRSRAGRALVRAGRSGDDLRLRGRPQGRSRHVDGDDVLRLEPESLVALLRRLGDRDLRRRRSIRAGPVAGLP